MPFESQVITLSETELDKLFDQSPEGSPNANILNTGIALKDPQTTELNNTTEGVELINTGEIPLYDDSLDEIITDEPIDEPNDKELPKEKVKSKKVEEPLEDKPTNEDTTTNPEQIQSVLTNTVDYLIKSGKWVDFEGREDLEITEEVYADLVAKQDEYRLSQTFNELVDSTGSYGKAIINHIKNGGNPDEIIDLFKEEKQLKQIDTSTEAGKQLKIEKYYSEILGWKPERVEKTIKRLITDNEINSEFTDVEEEYDKHYKAELGKIEQQTRQEEEKNKLKQDTFISNIKTALKDDSTLNDNDKKLIESSVFNFRHKLPNGQKVNDFYIKFAEMQNDPKEYVQFVRYVMDRENYIKSIQRKEKTEANKKAFNFIKGNAALSKPKNTVQDIDQPKINKGTDFSFAFKK